ncbi:MAG: methyltransferase [Deltaproteobacteria bacterium]|nr:methyltransferase [Deltaproteobacteria bacterium]
MTPIAEGVGALGRHLAAHVGWWRPRPFALGVDVPWAHDHPEAARWLASLDHARIDHIEGQGALPDDAPGDLVALERATRALVEAAVPGASEHEPASDRPAERFADHAARREAAYVPGRKRAQIEGLAARVVPRGPIVDWCGGKGHLGRTLGARHGVPVIVIEREAAYADEARALADRLGVHLDLVPIDALAPEAERHLGPGVWAVGLHACGALGVRLLEAGARRGVAALALAPCCLHKDTWRPLSEVGRALDPGLDHSALRLATSDEVVAPPRLRAARRRENAWRLGLDLLLREASGRDAYTPLGTLPAELLRAPFEVFCREAALLRGLALPAAWDPVAMEREAHARALAARALGLARGLFRRALELFVTLDRARFLEERGYAVDVTTFCARSATPRNLVIRALAPA